MDAWGLPTSVQLGGREYTIHADFRDILDIIRRLEDPDEPEYLRWRIALALFYEDYETIPPEYQNEAAQALANFINCGREEQDAKPAPRLLDWDQDAPAIVADINKAAGCEVRALEFLHWWSFVAYFHAIGEGQLSTLVSIRDKLRRGKKLEKWERDFYRENKARVDLKKRYSAEELAEQERLKKLLGE